ncbi:MAG: Uma2 family endonuclease [Anaerolineae bacterium]|nr:Uma2 family endonuclease [Anaerolineae bacterium]NUQ06556.1 Uma2 family endonuclease [Anaerolineae bacterium]
MTLPERTGVRLEDYLALPETNLPMELIDGEIIEMATPDALHQDVTLNCALLLRQLVKAAGQTHQNR